MTDEGAGGAGQDIEVEVSGHPAGPQRRRRPRGKLLAVSLIITGLVLVIVPSPVAVVNPVPALDLTYSFEIEGVDRPAGEGRWLGAAVTVQQPNLLGLGMALLRGRETVFGTGEYADPYEIYFGGLADHEHSRMLAAVAAAQALGLDATVNGTGAEVSGVDPEGPAAGLLEPGDVIESIVDDLVLLDADAVAAVASHPPGSTLRLGARRGEEGFEVDVTTRLYDGDPEELPRLGVELVTADFSVDLPFRIRFRRDGDVIGPSAGLAYALAIADALDSSDLSGGRSIAATGHLDGRGGVHPVGGVSAKAIAVAEDGARLFFVPASIEDQGLGRGVEVHGVSTLREALEILRSAQGDE